MRSGPAELSHKVRFSFWVEKNRKRISSRKTPKRVQANYYIKVLYRNESVLHRCYVSRI
jgi:chorismate synthase